MRDGGRAILEIIAGCGYFAYTPCGFDRRARGLFGGPCFFGRESMRTFVYVDGFNLYYGVLKGTSWKWQNLVVLFERILRQDHDILAIKYFAARVSARPLTNPRSRPR